MVTQEMCLYTRFNSYTTGLVEHFLISAQFGRSCIMATLRLGLYSVQHCSRYLLYDAQQSAS